MCSVFWEPNSGIHIREWENCVSLAYLTYTTNRLHVCAHGNEKDAITECLKQSVDINAQDADGNTALHYSKHNETMQQLVRSGANLDIQNQLGKTALMCAMEHLKNLHIPIFSNSDLKLKDNEGNIFAHYFNISCKSEMHNKFFQLPNMPTILYSALNNANETPIMKILQTAKLSYALDLQRMIMCIPNFWKISLSPIAEIDPLCYICQYKETNVSSLLSIWPSDYSWKSSLPCALHYLFGPKKTIDGIGNILELPIVKQMINHEAVFNGQLVTPLMVLCENHSTNSAITECIKHGARGIKGWNMIRQLAESNDFITFKRLALDLHLLSDCQQVEFFCMPCVWSHHDCAFLAKVTQKQFLDRGNCLLMEMAKSLFLHQCVEISKLQELNRIHQVFGNEASWRLALAIVDKNGNTLLHLLSQHVKNADLTSNDTIVRSIFLHSDSGSINSTGETAMEIACKMNNGVMKKLLQDVNKKRNADDFGDETSAKRQRLE